jgi:pectinesterase
LQPVVPAQRGVLGVHLGGAEVGRVVEQQVVEQVQTLLSATVTNQLTCYDGLEDSESSIASVLSEPLNNVTQLYSVSLGLVTQALDRNLK